MGSTVVGQEDTDFETIPEGTATDEFKAAKAEHLFIERGLTYEVKIVGYRELLDYVNASWVRSPLRASI
jgi:hypothetical protein